jgi:hypothetical protein
MKLLSENCKGREQLGKLRCIWKDNIKVDFRNIRCEDLNWIEIAERKGPMAFVQTVMKIRTL